MSVYSRHRIRIDKVAHQKETLVRPRYGERDRPTRPVMFEVHGVHVVPVARPLEGEGGGKGGCQLGRATGGK